MSFFKRLPLIITLASASALTPLIAQTVADETMPQASLDIPDGQTLFRKDDPNIRKATAQVNGEIITGTDIDQRLALLTNGDLSKLTPEQMVQARQEVLASLIDETLKIQEAVANEIEIKPAEVDAYFANAAQETFKKSLPEVEKYLTSIGSSSGSLKRQIRGDLAWNCLLSRNVRPNANVSDGEVNAILERMKADKGKKEYRVAEIYLSSTPETQEAVMGRIKKIIDDLSQGANFAEYARRFSEASTAAQGGDLGWVRPSRLPANMATAVADMGPNQIVAVPSPGGVSLLLLIDTRQVATADPRDSVLSLKQVAINFPAKLSEAQFRPALAKFEAAAKRINGCGQADDIARELGAEVVNRDGIRICDLPGPLQEEMLKLQVGQSTPPYGSPDEGLRSFVICGRDAPRDAQMKTFDQIMQEQEDERVNKRAVAYLRDIRRDAIIEYN